jgi:hypothetical protein
MTASGKVILAGKNGNAWVADIGSGRFASRYRLHNGPVFALASIDNDLMAIGTDDGLEVGDFGSPYRERVVSIATADWGAAGSLGAIITGSNEGIVRRMTMAGKLSQVSDEAYERVGRRVNALLVQEFEVIAASGNQLVFLDQMMRTKRTMPVPFPVTGMAAINPVTLVLCGDGNIVHVNLESGSYSRIITASSDAPYCCVAPLNSNAFYFGTSKGRLGVMALSSGEELGSVDLGFELRGILPSQRKVLAYGGDWKTRGRSAAILTMESITRAIEAQSLEQ